MTGFTLSAGERAELIAIFDSLTDEALLVEPRFSSPWSEPRDRERDRRRAGAWE